MYLTVIGYVKFLIVGVLMRATKLKMIQGCPGATIFSVRFNILKSIRTIDTPPFVLV